MLTLEITVDGDDKIVRALNQWARDIKDFRPAWRMLEDDFYSMMEATFATEGGRTGSPWQRLSEGYRLWKERVRPGRTILVFDGDLREGLTQRGGAGQVRRVTKDGFTIGTSDPKGRWHQDGADLPHGELPARPFVVLLPADETRWTTIVDEWAYRTTVRAMGRSIVRKPMYTGSRFETGLRLRD